MSTYKNINTFRSHYIHIIKYQGHKDIDDALTWLNENAPADISRWGWFREESAEVRTVTIGTGGTFNTTYKFCKIIVNYIGFNDKSLAMMFKLRYS
jgi:hypothetical protein